jgi:hypothetical protein
MKKQVQVAEPHLPHANGTFPYYVVRITGGFYQILPINWHSYRAIIAKHCPEIELPEDPSAEFKPSPNELKALLDLGKIIHERRKLRCCLVLGPEHCYYFEPDNVVKEHTSIPKGGVIIGTKGEIRKMFFIND